MTPQYPLRLFFDCSTAHLSPESIAYLDHKAALSLIRPESWIAKTPYGWFVWTDEEPDEDQPVDLVTIMRHARRQGAEYILFDADAPENAALPLFVETG